MSAETRITVPVDAKGWIVDAMTEAGITVLDTGERVTTETGVGAEAVLTVATFEDLAAGQPSIKEPPMSER